MIKTQTLTRLDACLKDYISFNNNIYKRNIQSVFMGKKLLQIFYDDMQEEMENNKLHQMAANNSKAQIKEQSKNNRKKRSISCLLKENKNGHMKDCFGGVNNGVNKKVEDWRNVQVITMNKKAFITNPINNQEIKQLQIAKCNKNISNIQDRIARESEKKAIKHYEMPCLQVEQFYCISQLGETLGKNQKNAKLCQYITQDNEGKEQLENVRYEQEQKCINRYRLKTGKIRQKFKSDSNLHEKEYRASRGELENIKYEDKLNRKINGFFQEYVDRVEESAKFGLIKESEAMNKERQKRDEINKSIRPYFIKNSKYVNGREIKKQKALLQKFKQGKTRIQNELKNYASKWKKQKLQIA